MTKLAEGRDSGYYDERLAELDTGLEELRKQRAEVRRKLVNAKRREARQATAEAEREEREEAWRLWRVLRDCYAEVGEGEMRERVSLLSLLRDHLATHPYPRFDGAE